jgi:hypothetical protein
VIEVMTATTTANAANNARGGIGILSTRREM